MTGLSPVSHLVRLDNVPRSGIHVVFDADAAQRAALAAGHGLLEVDAWQMELQVMPWKQGGFRLTGTIRAAIVQQCVVTLAPLPADLEIPLETLLVPEGEPRRPPAESEELVLSPDSVDEPETFAGNRFDVGAYGEELFALALDPYPRAPGAELAVELPGEDEDDDALSPFARLKDLGRKE